MKYRVVHLSSVHLWDDARITQKECATLEAAGYDVALVAGSTDSPRSIFRPARLVTQRRSRKRLWRMTAGVIRTVTMALRLRGNVYHIHDPELLWASVALKIGGGRVVYDAHEDVAGSIMGRSYIHQSLRLICSQVFRVFERLMVRHMDAIVAATPAIERLFPGGKSVLVQNYPRLEEFASVSSINYAERPLSLVFTGGITRLRGICEMLEAVTYVASRHPDVALELAGGFRPDSLRDELSTQAGWKHVRFHGWLSRNRMNELLASSRIGLLLFQPAPNHSESQPNKLFEYMASGLPVVASNFPLWQEIIDESGCGLVADPQNPLSIAEAVCWLLENPVEAAAMGKRGRAAVISEYNWATQAERLLGLYRDLLDSAPSTEPHSSLESDSIR